MSDHDEPTEPSAAVNAADEPVTEELVPAAEEEAPVTEEVVAADAEASGEPASPKKPLFAAVNARRVSIALVIIALVWLGVWAYSSDSTATSSPGTSAAAAPAATTPAGHGQRQGKHHGEGATTTLAPPPNVARTPQAYATAFIGYWLRHDRTDALRVATVKAVNHLFPRVQLVNESLTARGCRAAGASTYCTWAGSKRQIVLQVQNPVGSTPVRVIGVTVSRL